MGSGGDTQQTTQSSPAIPKWLKPLMKGDVKQWEAASKDLPSLSQLFTSVPQLGIPGLTAAEQGFIGQMENLGQNPGQLTSEEQAAQGQYNAFLGQNGPSAATQAELKQFNDLQAPAILQQAALMGQGNSGAALSALAQGQESALVPFLQQDEQNKFNAATGLMGLGATQADRQRSDIANALQAAGMPRDIATQQAQALFNQLEQQFQFAEGVQKAPFSLLGSAIGGGASTTVSTPSKF